MVPWFSLAFGPRLLFRSILRLSIDFLFRTGLRAVLHFIFWGVLRFGQSSILLFERPYFGISNNIIFDLGKFRFKRG